MGDRRRDSRGRPPPFEPRPQHHPPPDMPPFHKPMNSRPSLMESTPHHSRGLLDRQRRRESGDEGPMEHRRRPPDYDDRYPVSASVPPMHFDGPLRDDCGRDGRGHRGRRAPEEHDDLPLESYDYRGPRGGDPRGPPPRPSEPPRRPQSTPRYGGDRDPFFESPDRGRRSFDYPERHGGERERFDGLRDRGERDREYYRGRGDTQHFGDEMDHEHPPGRMQHWPDDDPEWGPPPPGPRYGNERGRPGGMGQRPFVPEYSSGFNDERPSSMPCPESRRSSSARSRHQDWGPEGFCEGPHELGPSEWEDEFGSLPYRPGPPGFRGMERGPFPSGEYPGENMRDPDLGGYDERPPKSSSRDRGYPCPREFQERGREMSGIPPYEDHPPHSPGSGRRPFTEGYSEGQGPPRFSSYQQPLPGPMGQEERRPFQGVGPRDVGLKHDVPPFDKRPMMPLKDEARPPLPNHPKGMATEQAAESGYRNIHANPENPWPNLRTTGCRDQPAASGYSGSSLGKERLPGGPEKAMGGIQARPLFQRSLGDHPQAWICRNNVTEHPRPLQGATAHQALEGRRNHGRCMQISLEVKVQRLFLVPTEKCSRVLRLLHLEMAFHKRQEFRTLSLLQPTSTHSELRLLPQQPIPAPPLPPSQLTSQTFFTTGQLAQASTGNPAPGSLSTPGTTEVRPPMMTAYPQQFFPMTYMPIPFAQERYMTPPQQSLSGSTPPGSYGYQQKQATALETKHHPPLSSPFLNTAAGQLPASVPGPVPSTPTPSYFTTPQDPVVTDVQEPTASPLPLRAQVHSTSAGQGQPRLPTAGQQKIAEKGMPPQREEQGVTKGGQPPTSNIKSSPGNKAALYDQEVSSSTPETAVAGSSKQSNERELDTSGVPRGSTEKTAEAESMRRDDMKPAEKIEPATSRKNEDSSDERSGHSSERSSRTNEDSYRRRSSKRRRTYSSSDGKYEDDDSDVENTNDGVCLSGRGNEGQVFGIPVVFKAISTTRTFWNIRGGQVARELEEVVGDNVVNQKINRAGFLCVNVATAADAVKLLNLKRLGGAEVESVIPSMYLRHEAKIRGVPYHYTNEKLAELFADVGVLSARRQLTVKRMHDGTYEEFPRSSVVLTFKPDATLPRTLELDNEKFIVEEYIEAPLQCFKCLRFGHTSRACVSVSRCKNCGARYCDEECERRTPMCANCFGPHQATYVGCPRRREVAFASLWKRTFDLNAL
ncbi:hypothetical protein HPB52_008608 [Rhipicephalus sanguineus]|uniref:Uncharacterized protein n=1 Tax=Rhipicephalus sanguineus TaxID=34632 RepID=A0A9D4QCY4_RHISA|nr:hypothetical protein HPB52_008608 [Rhipicephalus sanguineus]